MRKYKWHSQNSNPNQKEIDSLMDSLDRLQSKIDRLHQEQREYEKLLNDLRLSQYVLADANESFREHLCNVEYTNGYYQTIEEAKNDISEYLSGWIIYDLNGTVIEKSNEV